MIFLGGSVLVSRSGSIFVSAIGHDFPRNLIVNLAGAIVALRPDVNIPFLIVNSHKSMIVDSLRWIGAAPNGG